MKHLLFTCGAALLSSVAFAQVTPVDSTGVEQLDAVLVKSVRVEAESPITHSNVSKEKLEERNLGQDLPILLNYLPSVVTTSDAGAGVGYTGFRVRGTGNQGINVTINGIPYNDSESLTTFFVNLQDFSSSVESLQLQRGVGTSTNGGGAFGASLNILTNASRDEAYAEANASYGSFNTRRANVKFGTGLLNDHFTFSGRLSVIKSDGYVDRATSDLKSYYLQGAYKNDNTLIKLVSFGGAEVTYQAWNGIEDVSLLETDRTYNPIGFQYDDEGNLQGFHDNQVDDYRQDHVQLHWNQKYNTNWSTQLSLNYTYGRGFFEEYVDSWYYSNVLFNPSPTFEFLGWEPYTVDGEEINQTDLIRRRWLDNDYYTASLNVNYKDNQVDFVSGIFGSKYSGDHFGEITWARYFDQDSEKGDRYYFGTGDKSEFTAFAKATYKISDQWSLFGDIQGRFVSYQTEGLNSDVAPFNVDENYSFFNPKLGVSYSINNNNNLYLSYARANREPNRTDFENGNPEPERLNDFELGYRYKSQNLWFNANAYYMDYRNQLVLTGAIDDVGAPIRTNSGSSYRLGVELEAGIQIGSKIAIYPNLALSANKNRDFFFERDGVLTNLGNTNISYSPEIVAGNKFDFFPVSDLRLSLLSKYVGEQYLGNIDAESSILEGYFINDFNIAYTFDELSFADSIILTGLVNNIFDNEYISNGYFYTYDDDFSVPNQVTTVEGTGYYPQAGINFLVGATVRF